MNLKYIAIINTIILELNQPLQFPLEELLKLIVLLEET